MSKRRHPRPAARRRAPARRLFAGNSLYRRALRYEPLEDRRLLAVVTVDTLADTVDFNDGHTSLREAIFATNTVPGADTINFAPALTANGPATILLTQGELKITDALTINGPGASLLTIDASGNDPTPTVDNGDGSRIFNIDDGNATNNLTVAVSGLTLTGGDVYSGGVQGHVLLPTLQGGAILSKESLSVTDVTIVDNAASNGGGIYCSGGQLTVSQCDISGNRGLGSGGGIFTTGLLTVTQSTISGNIAKGSGLMSGGGGVYSKNDTDIESSVISNNSTAGGGGGVFATQGLTVRNSTIDSNVAAVSGTAVGGGGIFCGGIFSSQTKPLTITDSTVSNNKALSGEGGGIRKQFGSLVVENSTFTGNVAAFGGGLSAADGIVGQIEGSTFTGNSNTPTFGRNGSGPFYSGFGGGVFIINGTFSVVNCIIAENVSGYGGGIYTRNATVNIDRTSILDNTANWGGGILSLPGNASGHMTLTASTVARNHAGLGGGIAVSNSSLQIDSSTVSSNIATGAGGGIDVENAQLTVQFSTITANQSALGTGAGIATDMVATTLVRLGETIVAGNIGADVNLATPGSANPIQSLGFNLVGTGNAAASFNQPGDQVGVTNPMLGPLADNGGFTLPDGSHILTHALLAGSPAINEGDLSAVAGVNGVPQYDERGTPFTRVFNGRIDIGAFEYQSPSDLNLVVDTLVDESDGNYGYGDLSLREAIELANMYPGPNAPTVINTIHFDPALTANGPATILLTHGDLTITHGITIIGPGANLLTIDASGSDHSPKVGDGTRIISIAGGNELNLLNISISGLTLTGGDATTGGAIYSSYANLVLTGMMISGNTTFSAGGAIYAVGNELTVNNSTISGNVSTMGRGGAIYFLDISQHDNRTLRIVDSQISDNKSSDNGAGVAAVLDSGGVDINGSTLSSNSITSPIGSRSGGGLYVNSIGAVPAVVTIAGSSLGHNVGGGAFLEKVVATITDSRIESNSGGFGGGIGISGVNGNQSANSSIVGCTISGNTSISSGAGIGFTISRGTIALTNDAITNNTAANLNRLTNGGGVYAAVTNASAATFSGTTISGNSAGSGGGVYLRTLNAQITLDACDVSDNIATALQSLGAGIDLAGAASTATIHNSAIENNSAQGEDARGGGIFSAITLSIGRTKVSGNTSGRYGGGIYANSGLQIDTSEISGNSALLTKGIGGGVFRTGSGFFTLTNSTVSGNSATMDAGGLYFADTVSNIITSSTVTGNSAARDAGGIMAHTGTLGLVATTVSSNTAGRDGGGIWKTGLLSINGSTINNNSAGGNGGGIAEFGPSNINDTTIGRNTATVNGGGIWANAGQNLQSSTIFANGAGQAGGGIFVTAGTTAIYDSIVAADIGPSGADVSGLLGVTLNVHYSLIGSNQGSGLTAAPVGSPDANGNLIGSSTASSTIVPALGPLTMNGGPTATYAPLAGSVVINAGDPAALAGVNGVPVNDQRGTPFTRVYGGRIDIGAVESQPNPLPGDFNFNGVVDMADYVVWRNVHTNIDPRADANGDGRVDDADLAVWRSNFGNTYASSVLVAATAVASQSASKSPAKMMADLAISSVASQLNHAATGSLAPTVESSATAKRVWSPSPLNENGSFNQLLTLVATDRAEERQGDPVAEFSRSPASDGGAEIADSPVAAFDEAFAML